LIQASIRDVFQQSLLIVTFVAVMHSSPPQEGPAGPPQFAPVVLKSLSLEELSQIEVTTPSKQPVKAFQSPSAIYLITGEDIRRSGATSIPQALRLAPGVEVARIDANKWSIGIRGFGSRLTRSVLVLIDGRIAKLEPSARLLWTPTETQTVWTAFTHALRTPSDAEANFYLSGYISTTPDGIPFFARFNANPNFVS